MQLLGKGTLSVRAITREKNHAGEAWPRPPAQVSALRQSSVCEKQPTFT